MLARVLLMAASLAATHAGAEARATDRPSSSGAGGERVESSRAESSRAESKRAESRRAEGIVRQLIVETALAQVKSIDRAWQEQQRDCAGLVRYAYRTAYRKLGDERTLFVDGRGRPSDFADAETLVTKNFTFLGRDDDVRRDLRSGDILAFRSDRGEGEIVWHLMLVVVPAPGTEMRVVYHPGEPGARVRTGTLLSLLRDAPLEWRPVKENTSFLGFYRFRSFGGLS